MKWILFSLLATVRGGSVGSAEGDIGALEEDTYTMMVAPQPTALEADISPSVHREFLA